ncbi:MAG: transcriptional repressor [Elusimicrobiota bacterium]
MNINKKEDGIKFPCCAEKHLKQCFKKEGGRLTGPRKIIIDFFHKEKGHFTAEEVFEKLKKSYPGMGIATVYRNLSVLSSLGILNRFDFGEGKTKYELSENHEGAKNHHHHLICGICGKIKEYDDFMEEEKNFFDKIEKILSVRHNFYIKEHSLYFKGICYDCQKTQRRKNENMRTCGR